MRGRIAVRSVCDCHRGDHLAVKHDHASDRHFAGFSGVFAAFSAKSMKDDAVMLVSRKEL